MPGSDGEGLRWRNGCLQPVSGVRAGFSPLTPGPVPCDHPGF